MSMRLSSLHRGAAWFCALACAAALGSHAGDVLAQGRGSARFRRLVQQAAEAYNRSEPDVAINLLEQAYTINPNPLLLYNIGRAHELAGRLERALEYYSRFLAEHPEESQAQLGREARAGVQAQLDARARREERVVVTQVTTTTVPPPPRMRWVDQPRRFTAAHGALVVSGSVLAVAGGVLGALALVQSGGFASTVDPAQRAGFQDRGLGFAWGANVGIGLGVVLAGAGLIWWAAQPTRIQVEDRASEEASREPSPSSTGAAIAERSVAGSAQ
jgi:tetratricopeptide (TPR) repeat protein